MAAEHVSQRDAVFFSVGDIFSSYTSLKERIKQYEVERSVQFTHRDSRTLEIAKKRVPVHVACANSRAEVIRLPDQYPLPTNYRVNYICYLY